MTDRNIKARLTDVKFLHQDIVGDLVHLCYFDVLGFSSKVKELGLDKMYDI